MDVALRRKFAVLLVSHKRIQIIGGIEKMVELLFNKLVELGIPTSIVYRELFDVGVIEGDKRYKVQEADGRIFSNKTLSVRTFNPPEFLGVLAEFFFSFFATLKIMLLVKKYRKKGYIVVVHAMDTVFGGLAAFLNSKLTKTPYLAHTHGVRAYFTYRVTKSILVRQIDFLVEKTVVQHAKKLISVNDEARKFWIRRGIPKEKVTLIPVFIETEFFSPSKFTRNVVRKELGIGNESIVFGYVGRLSPEKNLLSLVEAYHLANFDTNTKLVIVGDGPILSFLKRFVQSKGLCDEVIFTGFRNDVHRIINAIDVLVLPSFIEGLPTVIIEAYANGRPVIASNIPAIKEIAEGGRDALLFDPHNPEQLKNLMLKLYNNPELRKKLGENARRKARQYDVNAVFPKILEVYREALGNKK
jgi:glycosyltransferase involved in cell wall biosynthesis